MVRVLDCRRAAVLLLATAAVVDRPAVAEAADAPPAVGVFVGGGLGFGALTVQVDPAVPDAPRHFARGTLGLTLGLELVSAPVLNVVLLRPEVSAEVDFGRDPVGAGFRGPRISVSMLMRPATSWAWSPHVGLGLVWVRLGQDDKSTGWHPLLLAGIARPPFRFEVALHLDLPDPFATQVIVRVVFGRIAWWL